MAVLIVSDVKGEEEINSSRRALAEPRCNRDELSGLSATYSPPLMLDYRRRIPSARYGVIRNLVG